MRTHSKTKTAPCVLVGPATVASLLLLSSVTGGCERGRYAGPREARVTDIDTLVSLESDLLAGPVDIDVAASGDVYVLDGQLASILVLSPDGDVLATIGAEGQGPGELSNPSALAVTQDSIRIVDAGNGRVQVLTGAGDHARSYPLPADYLGGIAIGDDGRLAVPTQGFRQEVLALTFDAEGGRTGSIGETVVPPHEMWDIRALKSEISRGRIPNSLRNMSLAVHDPEGGFWLILQAEGVVQRYDAAGELRWSTALTAPEMETIRAAFFRRNEELGESMSFTVLRYVADAVPHEGTLSLLLNTPVDDASVVLKIDERGRLSRRYIFPGLHGARELALDPGGAVVYLVVPSEASVLRAGLP